MRGDLAMLRSRRGRKLGLGAVIGLGLFTLTAAAALAQTVTSISVNGDCFSSTTTGTVSVKDVPAAFTGTLTLEIFAHIPGNGTWQATGATTMVTVTGNGNVPYSISGLSQTYSESPYNALRVQIVGESPSGAFGSSVNTKSRSFPACSPFIVPEAPLAIGLPLAGLVLFGGAFVVVARRRRHGAVAA